MERPSGPKSSPRAEKRTPPARAPTASVFRPEIVYLFGVPEVGVGEGPVGEVMGDRPADLALVVREDVGERIEGQRRQVVGQDLLALLGQVDLLASVELLLQGQPRGIDGR